MEVMELARATSLPQLAEWIGTSHNTVANWDKRNVVPEKWVREAQRRALVLTLQRKQRASDQAAGYAPAGDGPTVLRTGADDLPTGALTADIGSSTEAGLTLNLGAEFGERRYAVIPRYAVLASAGTGKGDQAEEQIGEFAFEVGWMQRNLGRSGRGFASVVVRGDSMQPTLLNGDEIIIDKHVHRVDVSGIYVIGLRGDLLVKRVQRMLDGSLVVRSDNTAYAPEELSADRAEDFRVVGRMVWPRVR